MPLNGSYESSLFFYLEGKVKPFRWWQTKPVVCLRLASAKTESYHVKNQQSWRFYWNNSFNFTKTFGGTLNFQYEPDSRYLDTEMKTIFAVSGSLYKTFLDDRLQCSADFTLYRKKRDIITETADYRVARWDNSKEPYLALSLTWYFRGGQKVKVKQNANSIQDYRQYFDTRR